MSATEDPAVSLQAVANHPASAMGADGRKRLDGALEAIEDVRRAFGLNLESLVIVVSADLTDWHRLPPSFRRVCPSLSEKTPRSEGRREGARSGARAVADRRRGVTLA